MDYGKGKGLETILVTGGAGFIGSNFLDYFLRKYNHYRIISIDKLTYAGNMANLDEIVSNPSHIFIKGDISNRELIEYIFKEFDIKGVIHFAAESHVDNSISEPDIFIRTNVIGTFVLIDVARNYWMKDPQVYREGYRDSRFYHISTDEVYGTLGNEGYFREDTPYSPRSPYSASKASSDMIVRSYYHTYGFNCIISNCSNNYGPKQHKEKLIPTVIRRALCLEEIPVYGNGTNIRDWLYVADHCEAIDVIYHRGTYGSTYNIGGRTELRNLDLVNEICDILDQKVPEYKDAKGIGSYRDLITFVQDRPGHDQRYAIDCSKLEKELGWRARESFNSGILKTVDWYLTNRS